MQREVEVEPNGTGRSLRMDEVRETLGVDRKSRFVPSARRSEEDRRRRHRERAIAAWLRDLSR